MRPSRSRLQTFHSGRSQQQQPGFPPQVGSCRVCGPCKLKEGTEGDTQHLVPSLSHGLLSPLLAYLSPCGSAPCKPEVQCFCLPSHALLKREAKQNTY